MERRRRHILKTILIFMGILFLISVRLLSGRKPETQPEGEKIRTKDVQILLEAVGIEEDEDYEGEYFTYGAYLGLLDRMAWEDVPDFAGNYKEEQFVLKKDWYQAFRIMASKYKPQETLWETTIFVLKIDKDNERLYSQEDAASGGRAYVSAEFADTLYQQVKVYVQKDRLLTVIGKEEGVHTLENVWIKEAAETGLQCFYHQTDLEVPCRDAVKAAEREQVADLEFQDGEVQQIRIKRKKIHGKLLRLTENEVEIDGEGCFSLDPALEIYRLYDRLVTLSEKDLKIGYADSDYVIEGNTICAVLVSDKEDADQIRVLLWNTSDGTAYYDRVVLEVDGERTELLAKDMKVGERRTYRSSKLTERIFVDADGVVKDDNRYRGSLECSRLEGGLVLINELPLEEYLYAVVPSEMPASYPVEALKAQAVCARTYGYRFILHAGLPELGAHVDDTTAYQVYHNCPESAAATTAVKETSGMVLTYNGEPAENYYYSTSCGVGTDASIWGGDKAADNLPYLRASFYCGEDLTDLTGAESCREEEKFRAFITSVREEDWEHEEPWYRWSYSVEAVDSAKFLERIQKRYLATPEKVLTRTEGGYYVSETVEDLGEIEELAIVGRGAGGVAQELLVRGRNRTVKILSEYNIRCVLCDGESEIIRQDGTRVTPGFLLPSGFFVMETGQTEGNMIRYTLTGGGYGHGAGMSQNGAKALGACGKGYEEILAVYFPGCEISGRQESDTPEDETEGISGEL